MRFPRTSPLRLLVIVCLASAPVMTTRAQTAPAPAAFELEQSATATGVFSPATQIRVEFWPLLGRFLVDGGGPRALQWASLQFRTGGKNYLFPNGLTMKSATARQGIDTLGSFAEVLVTWEARDAAHTPIQTSARLYQGFRGVLFGEMFPDGAAKIDARSFSDVGCAFPVFDAPAVVPTGLHWLSYTYDDWPIPIRGDGWPQTLSRTAWPASGSDDRLRTPLVFFDAEGHCEVVSPVDHGLQQVTALSNSNNPADWGVIVGSNTTTTQKSLVSDAVKSDPVKSDPVKSDPVKAPPAAPSPPAELHPATTPGGGVVVPPLPSNIADNVLSSIMVGAEGRLQEIPAGAAFHSVLVFGDTGVVDTVLQWGRFLQRYNGKDLRKAPDDFTDRMLGYWTDNGSAYYYRTEGNAGYEATMAAIRAYHEENAIPVRYYQLDSWWYPKGRDGGTLLWAPNSSTLPRGIGGIVRVLNAPLALHNRYWSSATPYRTGGEFTPGRGSTVPLQVGFFDQLFHTVTGWGCRLYEQDWLDPQFHKVDLLQTRFGAPHEWLSAMDTAAAHYSMPIQYCMPSIGFYVASSGLPNVTQVRTSRDFSRDNPSNVHLRWMEDIQVSLLARALGLFPSKDVLLTSQQGTTKAGAWEEAEAILAILSHGPVGIGDPFGHTDMNLVHRLCLEDGALAQADAPAIPVESVVTGDANLSGLPEAETAQTTLDGQTWRYLMTLDVGDARLLGENHRLQATSLLPLDRPAPTTAMLGPLPGAFVCYDSLGDRVLGVADTTHPVTLNPNYDGMSYTILSPVRPDGSAFIGDVSKYVSVSRERFQAVQPETDNLNLTLQGPAGSRVRLAVYDPNATPSLQIEGRTMAPDPAPATFSFYGFKLPAAAARPPAHGRAVKPDSKAGSTTAPGSKATPGVADGGAPAAEKPNDLFYFSFQLPSSARQGVHAILRTSPAASAAR